ncbi:MAG: VWA domain-containing protein [Flavobacteriaceae bacterium]|nr:VWA domain-containing protein [Flavobacteriaceae bacterium]
MYQIEENIYFYLFLLIPILVIGFMYVSWWKKKVQKHFAEPALLEKLIPEKSTFKPWLKLVFISLGIAFLVISLANPKMGIKLKTIKRQGVDIVFALDVSKSMLAEDIAPNRLEKSKQLISKIIDKLGSDRVGVIVYAGSAYPLLPITTDLASAKMFLQMANPEMVSDQGTAMNEALTKGMTYFDNDEQTNRFLFIVSDGEDHEGNVDQITKQADENGIRIFTIGVGSASGAPIPIKQNGVFVEHKKNQNGEVVITKLDETMLNEIAKEGNGKYILGNNTNQTIDEVEKIITNAEKKEYESKEFSDFKDQFQWFIGLGLLFLVLEALMFEKKTKWIQKLNLFNEK